MRVAPLLMGPDGAFITGSDVLMDGGVTCVALLRRACGAVTIPVHPAHEEQRSNA